MAIPQGSHLLFLFYITYLPISKNNIKGQKERRNKWSSLRNPWDILEYNPRSGFLWTSGFKPRLGTYDGSEIPLPLQIDIQHGYEDLATVTRDIFALTKLNYNACRLGEAEPVTIRYYDAVGEILVSNPKIRQHSPKFKFYI